MNTTSPDVNEVSTGAPAGAVDHRSRWRRRTVAGVLAAALVVAIVVVIARLAQSDERAGWQSADIGGQGGSDPPFAADAAHVLRRPDGLMIQIELPTPAPGTYEYPTAQMVPPWAAPHPRVSVGASDAPEVFTAWVFVFNSPAACSDQTCDVDDVGVDTEARGGSYQLDGLVADDDTLDFIGRIRTGQPSTNGATLDAPENAEVHVAIAPHGRWLAGADGWRQLNGPIGNPTLWWAAGFEP